MSGRGPLLLRFGLVALLAGCGGGSPARGPYAPGSVPQGGTCEYGADCAPVDGGYPACDCKVGSPSSPRCTAVFPIPVRIVCGGITCEPEQSCTASGCAPLAGEGASCDGIGCRSDLFCNAARVCEAGRAVGDSCDVLTPGYCALPAFCDAATAACVPQRGVGEACDPLDIHWAECASGLRCSIATSKCVAPQLNGAPCMDDADCVTFYCSHASWQCETRPCG